jgi:hypothetical protein
MQRGRCPPWWGIYRQAGASLAVPTFDPVPTFHGTEVRIEYAPSVRKAQVLDAEFRGLVRRQERNGISEDGLVGLIQGRVAQQDGHIARVVRRTEHAIVLEVTRQQAGETAQPYQSRRVPM